MAVVRDFYLDNGCHFKINDAELLPTEEERMEVIHRLERIVVRSMTDEEMGRRFAKREDGEPGGE